MQPISPASAHSANIAVPPFGNARDTALNVPGHIIPTEKPHSPQPNSAKTGMRDSPASRYDAAHRHAQKASAFR